MDLTMYTVGEIAKRLRVSRACVYALVESGKLPCYRIGTGRGAIRITEEHLRAYLDSTEKKSEPRLKHIKF